MLIGLKKGQEIIKYKNGTTVKYKPQGGKPYHPRMNFNAALLINDDIIRYTETAKEKLMMINELIKTH